MAGCIGSRLGLMRAVFFLEKAIWELLKVIWGPVEAVFGGRGLY